MDKYVCVCMLSLLAVGLCPPSAHRTPCALISNSHGNSNSNTSKNNNHSNNSKNSNPQTPRVSFVYAMLIITIIMIIISSSSSSSIIINMIIVSSCSNTCYRLVHIIK